MKLGPKQFRFLKQLLPFVAIWTLFGLMYTLIEYGILGTHPIYPATGNQYNFHANLTYSLPASILMGFVQGVTELLWLKRLLQSRTVWKKILLKTFIYVVLIIVFLLVLTSVTNYINIQYLELDKTVSQEVKSFFYSFSFWTVVLYVGVAVLLTLFVSEVQDYVGGSIFENFLLGKYHSPIQENRIFMFLDMRSSTSIAEQIGHQTYFNLMSDYYSDMTDAIVATEGEIYQYVGDEIVITWSKSKGLFEHNCLRCFYKIKESIRLRAAYYQKSYGMTPVFKAALHVGAVTTGEIGILKKEIVYTGDVLNTTARIQSKCNLFNTDLLVSRVLIDELNLPASYQVIEVDRLQLRGKSRYTELCTIVRQS